MDKFLIKPNSGVFVRDPETRKPLNAKGEKKPRNMYWLRRIAEGSVTVVKKG